MSIYKVTKQALSEISGADEYIACAAKAKAAGDTTTAADYIKMAEMELMHAATLYQIADRTMAKARAGEDMSQTAEEMWQEFAADYVRRIATAKAEIDTIKK